MALIDPLSKVGEGEALYITGKDGFKAMLVVASRSQPVTLEQAKPAIEQYLTAERRREFAQTEVKNLRQSAKIEYLGKFANKPASGAAASSSSASAPSAAASPADVPSAPTTVDADALNKGLTGLK